MTIIRFALVVVAAAVVAGATQAASAKAPARDVLAYYQMLVREKAVADVLEKRGGAWVLRTALNGDEVREKEKAIVDVQNGYLRLAFELGPCATTAEIAYFIAADKRNFVALSERDDCMETTQVSFHFFADAGEHLQPVSPPPIAVTCAEFLDEAGARDPVAAQGASRCLIVPHLPRVGTTVTVTVDGVTHNTGDDQSVSDAMEALLAKHRKHAQLEIAWDASKAQFVRTPKAAGAKQ